MGLLKSRSVKEGFAFFLFDILQKVEVKMPVPWMVWVGVLPLPRMNWLVLPGAFLHVPG